MHTILYLGLELPPGLSGKHVTHLPLIQTVGRSFEEPAIRKSFESFQAYSHLILTSKTAVSLLFQALAFYKISLDELLRKEVVAVGKRTAERLGVYGVKKCAVAEKETSEGVVVLLASLNLDKAHLFWPHAAASRLVINKWCQKKEISLTECILYDTFPICPHPLPDLNQYEEIVFTSPSTVDAFLACFGRIPAKKKLTCIGPVTQTYLETHRVR